MRLVRNLSHFNNSVANQRLHKYQFSLNGLIFRKKIRMASSAHEFDVLMNDGSTQSMSVYKERVLVYVEYL